MLEKITKQSLRGGKKYFSFGFWQVSFWQRLWRKEIYPIVCLWWSQPRIAKKVVKIFEQGIAWSYTYRDDLVCLLIYFKLEYFHNLRKKLQV